MKPGIGETFGLPGQTDFFHMLILIFQPQVPVPVSVKRLESSLYPSGPPRPAVFSFSSKKPFMNFYELSDHLLSQMNDTGNLPSRELAWEPAIQELRIPIVKENGLKGGRKTGAGAAGSQRCWEAPLSSRQSFSQSVS